MSLLPHLLWIFQGLDGGFGCDKHFLIVEFTLPSSITHVPGIELLVFFIGWDNFARAAAPRVRSFGPRLLDVAH